MPAGARRLYSAGVLVEHAGGEDAPLDEGSWRYNAAAGEALICVPLGDGLELAWR